jgi:colicin import membrane protein
MSIDDTDPNKHLDIPAFLRRQKEPEPTENSDEKSRAKSMEAEQIAESEETAPAKPSKVKANGHDKNAVKPAKKAAPKAKAKASKTAKAAEKAKPKAAKAKPGKPKAEKDQFGLRKDSAKSEAAAMYARKSGATLEEVKEKVGSIQLNVLKELEADGYDVRQEKQERKGKRPVTRYWLSPKK